VKTWKTSKTVCASKKTGRFVKKWACRAFKKRRVKRPARKGQLALFDFRPLF